MIRPRSGKLVKEKEFNKRVRKNGCKKLINKEKLIKN